MDEVEHRKDLFKKIRTERKTLLHTKNLCMKIIKEDHQTQHQVYKQT